MLSVPSALYLLEMQRLTLSFSSNSGSITFAAEAKHTVYDLYTVRTSTIGSECVHGMDTVALCAFYDGESVDFGETDLGAFEHLKPHSVFEAVYSTAPDRVTQHQRLWALRFVPWSGCPRFEPFELSQNTSSLQSTFRVLWCWWSAMGEPSVRRATRSRSRTCYFMDQSVRFEPSMNLCAERRFSSSVEPFHCG